MSEAKPAEKPAEEAPAAVAGDGGLKKLVVLLLVFVVLMFLGIIGGGVYLFVLKPPVPMVVPAEAAAHGGEHGEEGEEGQGVLQTSTLPPGYPPYGPYYRKVRPYYLDPNAVYGRVQRPAKPQLEKRPPTPIQQPTPKLPQPTKPGPTMRVK